jgi:hypothetical protein
MEMKFKGTKISKRTVALFAAAMVLLGSGGVMGTRAVPAIQSATFGNEIVLDALNVQLLNDGQEVGAKNVTEDKLFTKLAETITPGEQYESKVSVKNTGAANEYVRVVVRKYWTDNNGKNKEVDPSLIELTPATSSGYSWKAVKKTEEETIYYLNNQIASGAVVDLFKGIRINEQVVSKGRIVYDDPQTEGDTTTINYRYEYDGLKFNVEAEVQAVQTHNAAQAIKSVWGIDPSEGGINL